MRCSDETAQLLSHMVPREGKPISIPLLTIRKQISFAVICITSALALGCGADERFQLDDDGEWRGAQRGGGYEVETCSEEGVSRECHVEVSRTGDLVNCFSGTRTCIEGQWSACGGSHPTLSSITKHLANDASHGRSLLSAFDRSHGGCLENVCNPYCNGRDENTIVQGPTPNTTGAVLGTTQDITSFPSAKRGANASTCSGGASPADKNVCSYDYCCASTTRTCVQWYQPTKSAACTVPAGVDYTVGVGCQDGSGKTHIPICNRGNADSPSSGKLGIMGYPANPNSAGPTESPSVCQNSSSTPSEGCIIDLSVVSLKAGSCVDIDVSRGAAGTQAGVKCSSSSDFSTGNRTSQVNPPATTTLPNALKTANGGTTSYTQVAELDKCNNFSFVYTQTGSCATYGAPVPVSITQSYTYTATCDYGQMAQWNLLGYAAIVPDASDISLKISTANTSAGPFSTPIEVAHPSSPLVSDPASCPMSGSSGCPKSLYSTLGSVDANAPVLKLDVTLTATTAQPSLNSWNLNYSCLPSE
ncbi:MAG TPA: hypothetical protein VHM70_20175 [Polyangiaceae bacterium]|nr:hypothetical protein [Polyangiaceae bacterium]